MTIVNGRETVGDRCLYAEISYHLYEAWRKSKLFGHMRALVRFRMKTSTDERVEYIRRTGY